MEMKQEGTDLHDHEGNAVRVRPAGTLESHSKVDVGHVWLPDSHIRSSPEVGLLQNQRLVANMQAAGVHWHDWSIDSVTYSCYLSLYHGESVSDEQIFAYIRCK